MSHDSRITRLAYSVSVGGIAAIAMSIPTTALADPGDPPEQGVDIGAAKNQVDLPPADVRRLLHQIETGTRPAPPRTPAAMPKTREVLVDDGSLEGVQIALGALAGAAVVAGAVAARTTRQRHNSPHPA